MAIAEAELTAISIPISNPYLTRNLLGTIYESDERKNTNITERQSASISQFKWYTVLTAAKL